VKVWPQLPYGRLYVQLATAGGQWAAGNAHTGKIVSESPSEDLLLERRRITYGSPDVSFPNWGKKRRHLIFAQSQAGASARSPSPSTRGLASDR
jgi:hypothetical protein